MHKVQQFSKVPVKEPQTVVLDLKFNSTALAYKTCRGCSRTHDSPRYSTIFRSESWSKSFVRSDRRVWSVGTIISHRSLGLGQVERRRWGQRGHLGTRVVPLTLQALQRLVLQGPGGQAPLDGGVTGADGERHGWSLLLQREVQPVEGRRRQRQSPREQVRFISAAIQCQPDKHPASHRSNKVTDEKTKAVFWCTPRKVLFAWARLITLVFRTFRPLLKFWEHLASRIASAPIGHEIAGMGGGDPGSHVMRLIDICLLAAAATRDRARHGEWHNKGPFRFIF